MDVLTPVLSHNLMESNIPTANSPPTYTEKHHRAIMSDSASTVSLTVG